VAIKPLPPRLATIPYVRSALARVNTAYKPSYPSRRRLSAHGNSSPKARPSRTPSPICRTSRSAICEIVVASPVRSWRAASVIKTAIGSLLPDSSSNSGRRRPLRLTPLERRIEKTAAASVEETIDPTSRAPCQERLKIQPAIRPVSAAVSTTPMVAKDRLGPSTGRTLSHRVSRPPANRMSARATVPMAFAMTGSSK